MFRHLALLPSLVLLAACGGGSSSGPGGPGTPGFSGFAEVTNIAVVGVGSVGMGAGPGCTAPVPLNAEIRIQFNAAVYAATIPQGTLAVGSIAITRPDGGGTSPAVGTFSVESESGGIPGSVVVFRPKLPDDPLNPFGSAGLFPSSVYTVTVTGLEPAIPGASLILAGGRPLETTVAGCFSTCDPLSSLCFNDPVPGSPYVVQTTPSTSDPAPLVGWGAGTLSATFNEPLSPIGIDPASIQVVNQTTGQPVPGEIALVQAEPPFTTGARVDFIAAYPFPPDTTFEFILSGTIADLVGSPATLYDPAGTGVPPSERRLFTTDDGGFCEQTPWIEDFTTTQNLDTLTGPIEWNGDGAVRARFPLEVIGDGSFGALGFGPGPGTLDTGAAAGPGFDRGTWDVTTFNVEVGAVVRVIGPFQARIRSLGNATIAGNVNANAGMNAFAATGTPEQGPQGGQFGAVPPIRGGIGNAGGGDGGRAGQEGWAVRTFQGEPGFGPTIDGAPNLGPFAADPTFGGGSGGIGGFRFPSGGFMGELGGLGGAGGSAWEPGADGQPFTVPILGCMPFVPQTQPIAAATPSPPAMVFPITLASAGSGGGGGGSRFEVAGPQFDDHGGGGGGGGGGLRITAVGDVAVLPGAVILANGANGANGDTFFGGGGAGGSGGEIWLQSFADVLISGSAQLQVTNGGGANLCGDHASGAGGNGLYQFEDADGMINTNFLGSQAGGMNINVETFPFGTSIIGTATSLYLDTGEAGPTYLPPVETSALGSAPGGTVLIEYQGAAALPNGAPDPSRTTPWTTAAAMQFLDGYRLVRFRITLSFDAPTPQGGGAAPTDTFPQVTQIEVRFRGVGVCP